jgi:hypothetical protein
MEVRFFDRASQCLSDFGPSRRHFMSIWLSCTTPFNGRTGDDGRLSIDITPGRYQVIGEFPGEEDIYIGSKALRVKPERTTRTRLSFNDKKSKKKEKSKKKISSKSLHLKGSGLLIIESDYVEWESYPFVLKPEGGVKKRKKKALNRKLTTKEMKAEIRKATKARKAKKAGKSRKPRPVEG